MQFDTYIGLDSYVPEASWFPLICEVYNDGPAFNGTIEVTTGMGQSGYPRLVPIELPTGTRKRVSIPPFAAVLTTANGMLFSATRMAASEQSAPISDRNASSVAAQRSWAL